MNFLFFILISFILKSSNSVKVSVYYEALCPDSVSFIVKQLAPTYAKLKNYIELDLVPFGKAFHSYQNKKWYFQCQHGTAECMGNKYQSCALAQKKGSDKDMAFVNCVMSEQNPSNPRSIKKCANNNEINWQELVNCARGKEGDRLLAANGDKTYGLEISISFVPTIVVNDIYDEKIQYASLNDLMAVVCSKITQDKPKYCDNKSLPIQRRLRLVDHLRSLFVANGK